MIWQRYFLKELAKVFFLFLGSFYFLFVLIDFSTHTKLFQHASLGHISLYYLLQFSKRADILVPIALLIAVVKVLTALNVRHEIVALLSGGVPLKKLMRPFLLAGGICAAALYLNFHYLYPLTEVQEQHEVGVLPLADHSLFLYQKEKGNTFEDAYWFQSPDHFFHISKLELTPDHPVGHHVDELQRKNGQLTKIATFETLPFPRIAPDPHPHLKWRGKLSDQEANATTRFIYECLIPLACLLVVIAPAPFCLRFGRHTPIFMLFTLALFGVITFFTFVNASVILGQSQVLPPLWAILTPMLLFFAPCGWYYHAKL